VVLILGDDVELDERLFEVRRGGRAVALEPQAFDVLLYLVHHRDRVVAKEELMDTIWGGRFVSETTVTSRIKQARKAVGDDGQAQSFIRTLHGRGYRFVAKVVENLPEPVPARAARQESATVTTHPPVHYTLSDGLHIAYQVTGGGDTDIVFIPGFVSHLEIDWDEPRHAHFLERLGTMGRLIRFDKRGTGMSDRPPGVPDLETRMHDILAVMDAVGSERAVVCGYSEGGPMAMLLAAMHPQRVSALVVYGTYARRLWIEDYPWAQTEEQRIAYTNKMVTSYDWEADLYMRCPSGDPAMAQWWSRRMRSSATPGTIQALMDMNSLVDVRALLPRLRVPTLVLHRRNDPLFAPEEAQYIAERIPGAELVMLEGTDHLPCVDPDQILDVIEPFIATASQPAPHLALAAVVAAKGLDAENVVGRLVESGGRVRYSASGDKVVTFDGPATAVRAGLTALDAPTEVALGLSIAEIRVDGGPITGSGVEWAVSLARQAPAGQLLVAPMASVLLSGSGIELEPQDVESVKAFRAS
jgi:pimeloyl-ACP methyl ester carboxylesterase